MFSSGRVVVSRMYRVTITLVTKAQSKMFSISFINKIEIIHPQFPSVPLGCSAWLIRQNKKICVSVYLLSLSLGHRLIFLSLLFL